MRSFAIQRGLILPLAGLTVCCLLVLGGCQVGAGYGGETSGLGIIEGSVTYRERMLLLPGAQLEVRLQNVPRADAPPEVVASVQFPVSGGPPFLFELEYDRADLTQGVRYALNAVLTGREGVKLVSPDHVNPFGEQPIEVVVRGVAQ